MLENLIENVNWEKVKYMFVEQNIMPKTILLSESEIATHLFFIKKGCLRVWFNKDGKDITLQFFLEGQAVASIDSFISGTPSLFNIESVEPTTVISICKEDFDRLNRIFPNIKEGFQEVILQRFRNYSQLFLSRLKDTPKERYEELLINRPEIINRIPQHYIASYLGITPVSLSRIRNKK